MSPDRDEMIRQVRQRLESLRRAGVDRIPRPPAFEPSAPAFEPTAPATKPTIVVAPAPPIERPPTPKVAPPPVATLPASLFGNSGIDEPEVSAGERPIRLADLANVVSQCEKCPLLVAERTQTVFGEGSPTARLMFIGEGPGEEEDRTGRPFVGRAGVLLTDMITKGMGLARADVYIANVVKSRPPGNRNPLPEEVANCLPYLEKQIAIIRPQFLCLLGKIAASTLLETSLPMNRLRGKWHTYRGIPAIATWHPAYLLRNPAAKKEAWEDLQMLMKRMGIKPPERKG